MGKDSCKSCGSVLDEKAYPVNVEHEDEVVVDKEMAEKIRELSKEL